MSTAKEHRFRELREARGLSAGELALRIGVDEATIRKWESGAEEPDAERRDGLAAALGVSQDELRHDADRAHHPGAS